MVQIATREEDNYISSWIAAETIHYLNSEKILPKNNEFKTKLHKIVYLVAEKEDIPITRGWFMYGPFICNYDDFNTRYDAFMNKCKSRSYDPLYDFSNIKSMDINIEAIHKAIMEIAPGISISKADDCMKLIYEELSPKEYKDIYIEKYKMTGVKTNISALINYNKPNMWFLRKKSASSFLEGLLKDVDKFEEVALNTFDDPETEDIAISFFDVFRDSLWKIYKILYLQEMNVNISTFISYGKEVFIDTVWSPYAGEILKNTAKGFGIRYAKERGQSVKKAALKKAPESIKEFISYCKKNNFYLNYEETSQMIKETNKEKMDKNIWQLVKFSVSLDPE